MEWVNRNGIKRLKFLKSYYLSENYTLTCRFKIIREEVFEASSNFLISYFNTLLEKSWDDLDLTYNSHIVMCSYFFYYLFLV